jgi:hypothetical protein
VTRVVHVRQEAYDVYVGRPSDFGNPFGLAGTKANFIVATREEAISKYRDWLLSQPDLVARVRAELKDKVIACWCAPLPCHADVLAEIADS